MEILELFLEDKCWSWIFYNLTVSGLVKKRISKN